MPLLKYSKTKNDKKWNEQPNNQSDTHTIHIWLEAVHESDLLLFSFVFSWFHFVCLASFIGAFEFFRSLFCLNGIYGNNKCAQLKASREKNWCSVRQKTFCLNIYSYFWTVFWCVWCSIIMHVINLYVSMCSTLFCVVIFPSLAVWLIFLISVIIIVVSRENCKLFQKFMFCGISCIHHRAFTYTFFTTSYALFHLKTTNSQKSDSFKNKTFFNLMPLILVVNEFRLLPFSVVVFSSLVPWNRKKLLCNVYQMVIVVHYEWWKRIYSHLCIKCWKRNEKCHTQEIHNNLDDFGVFLFVKFRIRFLH